MLQSRLGKELFQRLTALREDLTEHPAKAVAIAYLQS
jgi:hypothetical protein